MMLSGEVPCIPQIVEGQQTRECSRGHSNAKAGHHNDGCYSNESLFSLLKAFLIQQNDQQRGPAMRSRNKVQLPELDARSTLEPRGRLQQQQQRPENVGNKERITGSAKNPLSGFRTSSRDAI
jgi:hypothetical protein